MEYPCEKCGKKMLVRDKWRKITDIPKPKSFFYACCEHCGYRCCVVRGVLDE